MMVVVKILMMRFMMIFFGRLRGGVSKSVIRASFFA